MAQLDDNGLGGPEDPEAAAVWDRRAAEAGDPVGEFNYGIDPATGAIKWHYQTTPREGWDFDGVNEVIPYVDAAGNKRYATADRNGFFYVLNRDDGAFVAAYPFVKNISWATGIGADGRPQFIEDNRPGDPAASTDGQKGEIVFAVPSFLGGKNWLAAHGLQPADRPVLCAVERMGHGHLERADHV